MEGTQCEHGYTEWGWMLQCSGFFPGAVLLLVNKQKLVSAKYNISPLCTSPQRCGGRGDVLSLCNAPWPARRPPEAERGVNNTEVSSAPLFDYLSGLPPASRTSPLLLLLLPRCRLFCFSLCITQKWAEVLCCQHVCHSLLTSLNVSQPSL